MARIIRHRLDGEGLRFEVSEALEDCQAEGQSAAAAAQAKGEAEAVLTRAKAQAEANRILAKSITRELVEYEKIKAWDGKLPQFSAGAGTGTLISITPDSK